MSGGLFSLQIVVIPLVIVFAVVALTLFYLRRIANKNTVVKIEKGNIEWKELKCPICKKPMEQGFSLAGRGVIWREKFEKEPGSFSTVGSVLENTLSFGIPPALNLSWRCKDCGQVVLDHSRMIKIRS